MKEYLLFVKFSSRRNQCHQTTLHDVLLSSWTFLETFTCISLKETPHPDYRYKNVFDSWANACWNRIKSADKSSVTKDCIVNVHSVGITRIMKLDWKYDQTKRDVIVLL